MILASIFWILVGIIVSIISCLLFWVAYHLWMMGLWWAVVLFVAAALITVWWKED